MPTNCLSFVQVLSSRGGEHEPLALAASTPHFDMMLFSIVLHLRSYPWFLDETSRADPPLLHSDARTGRQRAPLACSVRAFRTPRPLRVRSTLVSGGAATRAMPTKFVSIRLIGEHRVPNTCFVKFRDEFSCAPFMRLWRRDYMRGIILKLWYMKADGKYGF